MNTGLNTYWAIVHGHIIIIILPYLCEKDLLLDTDESMLYKERWRGTNDTVAASGKR